MPKTPSADARPCHALGRTPHSQELQLSLETFVSRVGYCCLIGKCTCGLKQCKHCQGYAMQSPSSPHPKLTPSPEAVRSLCALVQVCVFGGAGVGILFKTHRRWPTPPSVLHTPSPRGAHSSISAYLPCRLVAVLVTAASIPAVAVSALTGPY